MDANNIAVIGIEKSRVWVYINTTKNRNNTLEKALVACLKHKISEQNTEKKGFKTENHTDVIQGQTTPSLSLYEQGYIL